MSGIVTPKDLKKLTDDIEAKKAAETIAKMRKVDDEKRQLREAFMERDVSAEAGERVSTSVRRAAERGLTEIEVFKFPATWTNDHGRRINNNEADWADSLEGFAKRAYAYFDKELRPLGYQLRAQVLNYPDGVPGEIGFILSWESGMTGREMLENRTFDEIRIGDTASLSRTLGKDDIDLFAAVSGDVNPAHLDEAYARESLFKRIIAHGMWSGALISNVLGTRLPGAGTIYLAQSLRFRAPVGVGDTITVTVTAKEKRPEKRIVIFDCNVVDQNGRTVLSGDAEVIAPAEKLRTEAPLLPEVRLQRHDKYARLIQATKDIPAIACAVAHPCDQGSLKGAIQAAEAGIIVPFLVGPERRIRALAAEHELDLRPFELVDAPHSHAAAAKAVELVRTGRADLLMKGSLHSDELLGEVVASTTGLRTERRISHVFIMDVPSYDGPLFITDAAVNIFPDLECKRDIVQNAIDLHRGLGLGEPRVAILSAVETVTPKIPSTIDAAALCKMADRGQITGGLLDGPLALDNAISPEAASIKGIHSAVAGRAQILLVPDLEAGNMLAKNLTFLSGADAAGVVLGARVPVILTSRADNVRTRMASTAVAALYAHHLRSTRPIEA